MKIRIPGWVKGQPVPSDLYYYSDGKRLGYTITVNGKKVEAKVTAVSYTHLDVYKRQPISLAMRRALSQISLSSK